MAEIDELVAAVERARADYTSLVDGLSYEQGAFSTSAGAWSIAQITEHLYHAELGGINLIWKAADAVRRGDAIFRGPSQNEGLSIEQVVERTWRPREVSPDSALPRVGGSIRFWAAALRSGALLLAELPHPLRGLELQQVIYPHAISGPLDARQRLQFLRFHMERHRAQVASIVDHPEFPE
jgi:hypothetical protein